jgi:hypothetical protein
MKSLRFLYEECVCGHYWEEGEWEVSFVRVHPDEKYGRVITSYDCPECKGHLNMWEKVVNGFGDRDFISCDFQAHR